MDIRKEVLEKYGLPTLEQFKENMLEYENERMYYQLFLSVTDHIPNKIIEAQVLGVEVDDYREILEYRQYCREMINKLI